MKTKVTKREITNNYPYIVKVDYCALQAALRNINPRYYTCGISGWHADIYEIEPNKVIVTGYAPFGNIKPKSEKIHDIEKKAERINSYKCKYKSETKARKIKELLLTLFDNSNE